METPAADMAAIRARIQARLQQEGFDAVGFAPAQMPAQAQSRFDDFIANAEYGDMAWMAETAERRRSPQALWPECQSVITVGCNYGPAHNPLDFLQHPERGIISAYAQNQDYHDLMKKALKRTAHWIVQEFGCGVKIFVDTAPILEKPLAQLAGIGWQGKHSNLVSRDYGSWLFLGEIFTDLALADPAQKPHADHCGGCQRCISICPTQAITAPYQLDARRCLAYLTIEYKGVIPLTFRKPMGNRIYGCDDCLAICPWNKFAQHSKQAAFYPRAELTAPRLADFLDFDDAAFRSFFAGSPIKRIGRDRFLRNILIALGNLGDAQYDAAIIPKLADPSALVRGMAVWALAQWRNTAVMQSLADTYIEGEMDEAVLAEWATACSPAAPPNNRAI